MNLFAKINPSYFNLGLLYHYLMEKDTTTEENEKIISHLINKINSDMGQIKILFDTPELLFLENPEAFIEKLRANNASI